MKRILTTLVGISVAIFGYSQNETDALRYSYLNYGGTARFNGLGGAMGALGADMSAISINPAGMGRYSRSDFSFTGNVTFAGAESEYNNSFNSDTKGNFNIPNIGVVFAVPIDFNKASMWRYFQVGISTNRTNDFHGRTRVEGINDNSMLLSYTNYLNNNNIPLSGLSDFYEGQAFDANLLLFDSISNLFVPWYDTANSEINQRSKTTTRGAQYQTDITFSGNYDGKLYVGGSIGFPRIRYNSTRTFTETFTNPDAVLDTENYTFEENVSTTGSGFNIKLGAIFVPVKSVRFGLAVHTPTWYSMSDSYNTNFTSNFIDNFYNERAESPEGIYDYRLRTPGRLIASAAFLYKKRGLISMEYELIDYSNASFNGAQGDLNPYNFDIENNTVNDIYQTANILKVGGEYRVTNHWTVRGGYAYFGSPIKDEVSLVDNSRTNISGGIGFKNQSFSLDFTFLRTQWQEESYLYDPELVEPIITDRYINNFMVTAGFRF
ncbi:MAG: outer membrane protein transport protein [Flavobacteriales bacterium]|jgi:long-subunit fatty acid transport protein